MNEIMIIAELGINHNGDIKTAKSLIDMTKRCGADAVKFQKRTVEKVYTKEFLDSPRESPWGNTQRDQKIGLELGQTEYDEIDRYCKQVGIDWFASAYDIDSLFFLRQYNLPYNKVASQMANKPLFLMKVVEERKPTFISTGLATGQKWYELTDALCAQFAYEYDPKCPITFLHCVQQMQQDVAYWHKYLVQDEQCQLWRIEELQQRYPTIPIGYSCHNPSILTPSLAVCLGAKVIEVHITLDRTMYGTDQSASFEEEGLKRIVRDCKRVARIIGGE